MPEKRLKNLAYLLLMISLVAVFVLAYGTIKPRAQTAEPNLVTAIETVAKQAIPAVVHVEVTERQEINNPLIPFENEPFFKYFFGIPNMPQKLKREVFGLGSGVILDASGHILTNYHVVGGATKIRVVLADGREFSGKSVKVVGTDSKTDLAVIQIIGDGSFPYLPLGNSDQVKVGQWVVAIGQPRGLSESVTQGIISAKHRTGLSEPSSYQDFLQTDAAINPGNSGGPLMNLNGEVIGINSAIISKSGGFEGLGFAIPSNIAAHVSRQLIKHGKVIRGWLGLTLQKITPELAKSFNLKSYKGSLVSDVFKDGPADHAGLKRGDVITEFQGNPVDNPSILRNDVSLTAPGTQVKLTIVRDGAKRDISIKIGNLETQQAAIQDTLKQEFGLTVRPMTSEETNSYGLNSEVGVAVVDVSGGSPFGKAGFQKDDIILQIDKNAVDGAAGLLTILRSSRGRNINVLAVDHNSARSTLVQVHLR
ncbi:MAG: Do family serine endopeptidase [Syntrophobacteraceae bacterium]|nr:Do family serine endopeptidase [Syntrophobacteraceae bacterium]